MLPKSYKDSEEYIDMDFKTPSLINILSKNTENKTKYVGGFLDNISNKFTPKEVSVFVFDIMGELKNRNNPNILNLCTDSTEVLAVLEVLKEVIDSRLEILNNYNCHDLKEFEVLVKHENKDYQNPPTIYALICNVEMTRLTLRDDGNSYLIYFDELLRYILKYSKKCNVGLIVTSYSILNNSYPKNLVTFAEHKLSFDISELEFTKFFNVLSMKDIDSTNIYYQKMFSKVEKVGD